jgi:NAD(P)-dependent dehydrogenase (short-subunit alcohol dehydrogenase family)
MNDLEGKAAIVTGGGSGIGADLVAQLCASGASVLAADLNEVGLAGVADRTGCITRVVDVASLADNAAMVGAAVVEFGRLDLLFLNAGVLGRSVVDQREPLTDIAGLADRYRHVMSANVDGVVHGTLAAVDVIEEGGAIVATASIAGLMAWAPDPAYTASKHGVIGWVRAIAPALEARGVTIDAICPSGVATPLVGASPDMAEADANRLSPRQVAGAIIVTALEPGTGRALSVVAGRSPERLEHEFTDVAGFS